MKCDKIAINKLEKSDINGNYLFSDNKNYYFDTKMRNSIFLKDKEEPSLVVSFDCYYKYFNELITVCKNSQNKPSILYFGNDYNNEIFSFGNENMEYVNQPVADFNYNTISGLV